MRRIRQRIALLAAVLGLLAAPHAASGGNLLLESDIEPAKIYVQAQARYTVRFYQAIDVRDLEIHDPVLPLAELRRAGDDRIDEATRDGRRYRVTERRYLLSPFASGKLVLDGTHVTGTVFSAGGTAPGAREPIRLDAPPLALEVLPIPAAAEGSPWLPAHALMLTESWGERTQEVRTGEPLHRLLRLEARGLHAAQLPALEFSGPGFHAYPETPRLENRLEDGINIGIREQGFRLLPTRPGELVVPALQLHWWDVTADRMRVAALPETTIPVLPGTAESETTAPPDPEPVSSPESSSASSPPTTPLRALDGEYALTFVAALLGSALLAGALWIAIRVGRAMRRSPLRALRQACRRNDAPAAVEALLRWGAQRWPDDPPRSLEMLAARLCDDAVRAAVLNLDRHCYGRAGTPWHRDGLMSFPGSRSITPSRATPGELPPLYPG